MTRLHHLQAGLVYALLSVWLVGHGAPLATGTFGTGSDPLQFVWLLRWFPWALAHGQSLLVTHLMWQPLGVPLLWVSSVPLLCLALMPLTAWLGPVVTYNLLILAAPVASSVAAYALCFWVTRRTAPALFGGFAFGFSSYETAANLATPNLSITFLLPCLVLVALRRLAGELGRGPAIALAAALMVAEFFISIEIFATFTLFATLAWALAYRMLADQRPALRTLLRDAIVAGAITAAALAPFLWQMARHAGFVHIPSLWPSFFVTDLLNFIVPTHLTWLGGQALSFITQKFPGILQEQDGYLGLPLLLILLGFGWARRREPHIAYVAVLLLLFMLLSLGPRLWVGGHFTGAYLPWALFLHLPLIGSALPARFNLFVALVAALMLALWLARPGAGPWRLAACVLACLALAPAPHPWKKLPAQKFFTPGRVQAVLGPGRQLLILPFGPNGPGTYWQAAQEFGFSQTGGYLGFPPAPMQKYPVVGQLFANRAAQNFAPELARFCAATGTDDVVAGPGTDPAMLAALRALGWPARAIDGVIIFTVPRTKNAV